MSDENLNQRGYRGWLIWSYQNYDRSIFRRTFVLLAFAVPAFCANLAAQYFAAAYLPPDEFGVFYLATTLVYVLFSVAFALGLFLTRHLILVGQANGDAAIAHQMKHIERKLVGWGAILSLVIFVGLLLFASSIGTTSWIVILMVVLDTYTSYIADLGRIYSLSMRRTLLLGVYTLAWMSLRALLGTICIIVFGTVWSALLGGIVASLIVYAAFKALIRPPVPEAAPRIIERPSLRDFLPLLFGYGLMMTVSQLDILLGYFVLSPAELSVYSASSVFPKALLVVSLPLLQMLFSMMVNDSRQHERPAQTVFIKSGVVMFALTAIGAIFFRVSSPLTCGGEWGVRYCDVAAMNVLLLAVVPLVMVRFLVLLEIARGRDYTVFWLVLPALVLLALQLPGGRSVEAFVREFVIFSGFTLAFMMACSLASALIAQKFKRHGIK